MLWSSVRMVGHLVLLLHFLTSGAKAQRTYRGSAVGIDGQTAVIATNIPEDSF